jgi:hypothetical protein
MRIFTLMIETTCFSETSVSTSQITLEDHNVNRLRVTRKRVPRKVMGQKGRELLGGRRKWHNREFRNLYLSPDIYKRRYNNGEIGRRGVQPRQGGRVKCIQIVI